MYKQATGCVMMPDSPIVLRRIDMARWWPCPIHLPTTKLADTNNYKKSYWRPVNLFHHLQHPPNHRHLELLLSSKIGLTALP